MKTNADGAITDADIVTTVQCIKETTSREELNIAIRIEWFGCCWAVATMSIIMFVFRSGIYDSAAITICFTLFA